MKFIPVLLAMIIVPGAFAGERDYNYLEARYFQFEPDSLNPGFDGFGLRGSAGFGNVLLFGDYREQVSERFGVEFDLRSRARIFHLGSGYAWSVNDRVDFIAGAGMARTSIDGDITRITDNSGLFLSPDLDERDTGYFGIIGIRTRFTERLDGNISHRFSHVLNQRLNEWHVDLRYALTPAFAIGAGYRGFESGTAVNAALRWSF